MNITFKVNTGIVKTGKNLQSRFNDKDKEKLSILEQNIYFLFVSLNTGKIKNTFGGFSKLDFGQKVDLNMLLIQGFKIKNFSKKIMGCFITYDFEIIKGDSIYKSIKSLI